MLERTKMESMECDKWTLSVLTVAFMELALAYCLLCGTAFMFIASKILFAFGLYLPCPCSGILGYKNKDLCLHKLLFEWPMRKIYMLQKLTRDRLLSSEIFSHLEYDVIPISTLVSSNMNNDNYVLKMGFRKGWSSVSGLRTTNSGHKDNDSDVRMRQKTTIQEVKGTGRHHGGRSLFVSVIGDDQMAPANARGSANDTQVMKIDIKDRGIRDEFIDEARIDSSSVKVLMHTDASIIKKLEHALREERAALSALAVELEKERAASSTAADEAMAMILRLQADKATLEMEAKQYERMMEEKSAYDEEEMTMLKEILIQLETENMSLEKELEAYKQIEVSDDESLEEGFKEHCNSSTVDDSIEKKTESELKSHDDGSFVDKEPIIYDIHVVEDDTEFHKVKTKEYEESEGSSVDYETAGMKLVEEIMNQLREISKDHGSISKPLSSAAQLSFV